MKALVSRVNLTAGRVRNFTCPAGKSQAFLWDTDTPTLAVRVTPTGRKTYVFEARLRGGTIRKNIGTEVDWPISKARTRAQELKMLVDAGTDPRELERQKEVERVAIVEYGKAVGLTVAEVWSAYLEARRKHWGETHFADHIKLARAGGEARKRMPGVKTIAMPLHALMALPLRDLTAPVVEAWAAKEALTRPTAARLSWRLLKVFLNWCAEQPEYAGILPAKNAAATRKAREALGKPRVKQDALLKEQLPAWFDAVRKIPNPVISAALQVMVLTGARPGEVLSLRWDDLNIRWQGLRIRDKVEGTREIPLTPYVAHLLGALPQRNAWVFSSVRALSMDAQNIRRRKSNSAKRGEVAPAGELLETSASGRISEPNDVHTRACKTAGLKGLTLHGLRRSFKSLTEWLEIPAGVVAQLMGHKPSATAEKHYTVRPLDLLRVHHEKIEAWILEQAGVKFAPKAESGKLRAVN